jgi:cytochrome P450
VLFDPELYAKHPLRLDLIRATIGYGLVGVTGEAWKKERKLLNPLFFHGPLKSMIPAMIKHTNAMVRKLHDSTEYRDGVALFRYQNDTS